MEKMRGTWYPDLCASQHFCNHKKLFKDLWPLCIDFIIAVGKIIQTKQVGKVSIPLKTGQFDLQNVILVRKCNSNLISPSQLRKTVTIFHDNPTNIVLMKDRKRIAHAKKS